MEVIAATRPFRPVVDHLARLLMFVGAASLFAGFPLFSQSQDPAVVWWLVVSFCLWMLGFIAQRFSTPIPLEPIPTPPAWHWMFFSIVLLPMLGTWIDWQGAWVAIPVIFGVIIGGWAAYLPEHRRQVIFEQYRAKNQHIAVGSET